MIQDALRLLRVFHDLKSNELAKKLDVSASYISELESGKKKPSLDIIQRYATTFHTTPSSIMFMAEGLGNDSRKMKVKISRMLMDLLQNIEKYGEA